MTRFTILEKHLTPVEIEALKALVGQIVCPADEIVVVNAIGDPDPDVEDDVILVLGTDPTCADAEMETNLAKAAKGARRAIWIWPKDAGAVELPPPAKKYGYSVIPWSAEKLRAVAADDDVTCFETPAGKPLPKVQTERNLCVEEKAKPKAK
jgi:hypothetical protein